MNITKAWLITGSRIFGDRVVVADHEADRVIYDRNDGSVKIALVPQPIYDEAKERARFEQGYHHSALTRDGDEYIRMSVQLAWEGWEKCAQSRAKAGEDE